MTYLLQFCGLSDPLQLFYLEQRSGADPAAGPVFAGFRPFQLDDLLGWAVEAARCRRWAPSRSRPALVILAGSCQTSGLTGWNWWRRQKARPG